MPAAPALVSAAIPAAPPVPLPVRGEAPIELRGLGFDRLFWHLRDAAIVADAATGRIVLWNPAAEALFGYSAEEAHHLSLEELIPERLRAAHRSGLARYYVTGHGAIVDSGAAIELPALRKTGDEVVIELSLSPVEPTEPTATAVRLVLGILRDVTARKRAEAVLQANEERLRTLVTNAPVILFALDGEGRFTLCDGRGLAALGLRPGEVVGQSMFDVYASAPQILADVRRALAGEPIATLVDIAGLRFQAHYQPIRGADGRVDGVIGVATDITERAQAEEARQRLEADYRHLFERAGDAVLLFEPDGEVVLDANAAACAMYGLPRDELVGSSLRALSRDVDRGERHLRTLLVDGACPDFETAQRRADGTPLEVSVRSSLVEFRGRPAVLSVNRDVTERKRLEMELRRAHRLEAAGRVAAGVAHDLNNLLAPLTGYPELIKQRLPVDHAGAAMCDAMLAAAWQMAALTEDLLALGRRGRAEVAPVDLNAVVRQVMALLVDRPPALAVRLRLSRRLPLVDGTAAQLARVLANLVANARDAMADAGTLTIFTKPVALNRLARRRRPAGHHGALAQAPEGAYACLAVQDTGSGIPPQMRNQIFEAFFTTKQTDQNRGSGLGLSVVQAIVADHGGFVDVESEVGAGTTFTLYLPARAG